MQITRADVTACVRLSVLMYRRDVHLSYKAYLHKMRWK